MWLMDSAAWEHKAQSLLFCIWWRYRRSDVHGNQATWARWRTWHLGALWSCSALWLQESHIGRRRMRDRSRWQITAVRMTISIRICTWRSCTVCKSSYNLTYWPIEPVMSQIHWLSCRASTTSPELQTCLDTIVTTPGTSRGGNGLRKMN
jgi:hypothetical protein